MIKNFLEQFELLSDLLVRTRQYWQLTPFSCYQLPWPELESTLNQIDLERAESLKKDLAASVNTFVDIIPELKEIETLLTSVSEPPKLKEAKWEASTKHAPFWLTNGVKGRKLDQIQAFISRLASQTNYDPNRPVLEWCAGKGHLGRLLSFQQHSTITSVEWQANLCEQGEQLAKQHRLPMSFIQADVLSDQVDHLLKQDQHAVALHACGELHLSLIKRAAKVDTACISVSPCCYHLIDSNHYSPMSVACQKLDLNLTKQDLKLARLDSATSGKRIERLRHQETLWRLAFDLMIRDFHQTTEYLSVPSVNKAIFSGSFSEFCQWAAEQKQLTLPKQIDERKWLTLAAERQILINQIEVVRHSFRRALEYWLILDRCVYLEENGYQVNVERFCDFSVTPRNFMIHAEHQRIAE